MSGKYKTVMNGRGTCLEIGQGAYISVGKNGKDVVVRGKETVAAFPAWEDLISAINKEQSSYYERMRESGLGK